MQHDGEGWRDVNKFTVHLDVVALAGLRAEVSAGLAVDSDPARCDQFIAMPTRSDTRSGKKTIKTHQASLAARFNVLNVGLCLRQADHFLTVLPMAAFLEKLHALEAFQHVALSRNGAGAF